METPLFREIPLVVVDITSLNKIVGWFLTNDFKRAEDMVLMNESHAL